MNNSRPARTAAHRDGRSSDMDYKAMTKNLLDRIDDNFVHRMIYEIVNSIVTRLDQFTH